MPTSSSSSKLAPLLVFLIGLAAAPTRARAEPGRDFQDHYQRAMALYKLTLYRQAVKEFVAAYALNPLPRLLYNLGQLLRRVGEYKDAVEAYELYLRTEIDLPEERKREVRGYLDALRSEAATPQILAPTRPAAIDTEPGPGGTGASAPLLLALPPEPELKAGRFMFNGALGYAFPIFDTVGDRLGGFLLRPDFGVAVTASRNGYLVFSPQFQGSSGAYQLLVTVGFQYDFPVLVRGLFLYIRGSAGYALTISDTQTFSSATGPMTVRTYGNYGVVMPEIGIKYVLRTRINFGFEPIGVPVLFNGDGAVGAYRLLFYSGVNF